MSSDLASKAHTALHQKEYESAIELYGQLCELEEKQGFNLNSLQYLIDYATALFKNAIEKNDVFDRQQQQMLQSSEVYKEKYTLLDVDEDVDDFETAFDTLERAKQIAADFNASPDVLGKIEQLLADICFEDSNFQQALESYLKCCDIYKNANESQKLVYTYYYVAMVYEFANSPSETMDGKDSSILPLNEMERILKAKEYIEMCLDTLKLLDDQDDQGLQQDVEQKVIKIHVVD